jgi:hypothetical protein
MTPQIYSFMKKGMGHGITYENGALHRRLTQPLPLRMFYFALGAGGINGLIPISCLLQCSETTTWVSEWARGTPTSGPTPHAEHPLKTDRPDVTRTKQTEFQVRLEVRLFGNPAMNDETAIDKCRPAATRAHWYSGRSTPADRLRLRCK